MPNALVSMIGDQSSTNETSYSSSNFSVNTWYYLTLCFDGQRIYFYKNGELLGSTARTTWKANANTIRIGQGTQGGWGGYFNGVIDDVRVYSNVLTPQQMKNIYDYRN